MGSTTQWFLVSNYGISLPLHQTMISLGREGCDVVLQSRSVEKRHALITYDHYEKRFKVKDLSSINGTYLNEARIPSQTFVKLEHLDSLRFGFVIYQLQVVERYIPPIPVSHSGHFPVWPGLPYSNHSMKMSECQGCLNKAAIQHTCDSSAQRTKWDPNQPPFNCVSTGQPPGSNTVPAGQDYCGNFVPSHLSAWNGIPSSTPIALHKTPAATAEGALKHQCHQGPSDVGNGEDASKYRHSTPNGAAGCNHQPSSSSSSSNQRPSCVCSSGGGAPTSTPNPSSSSKAVASSDGLQSNFSGDSLDLNHDDSSVILRDRVSGSHTEPPSDVPSPKHHEGNTKGKTENGRTITEDIKAGLNQDKDRKLSDKKTSNVMAAEKPYAVDDTGVTDDHKSKFTKRTTSQPTSPTAKTDPSNKDAMASSFPSCTAFTVDFDDQRNTSNSTKKFDIKDSISKFAPSKPESDARLGHRRNLSLPKVLDCFSDENGNTSGKRSSPEDEGSKKGSDGESTSSNVDSPTAGILSYSKGRVGGSKGDCLSEGHLSSDQDDSRSAKSDPARMPRTHFKDLPLKVVGLPVKLSKRNADGLTSQGSRRSLPVAGLRDSAKYLINKMFGEVTAPPTSPTSPVSVPVGPLIVPHHTRSGSRHSVQPSTPSTVAVPLTKDDRKGGSRSSLNSTTTYTVDGREMGKSHTLPKAKLKPGEEEEEEENPEQDDQVKEMAFSDEEEQDEDASDVEDDAGDNASETGTYTIEKDRNDDTEEAEARKNIDVVFGVTGNYPIQRPVVVAEDGGPPVELRVKGSAGRIKNIESTKSSPSWLKEWAVLEANKNNLPSAATQGALVRASVVVPGGPISANNNKESGQRTRRKLPVPPVHASMASGQQQLPMVESHLTSPMEVAVVSPANDRPRASSSSSRTSPEGRRSDSSMDTERILKETETVVTAMEARMDHNRRRLKGGMGAAANAAVVSSLESKDSGGESDLDTSTASGVNDLDLTRSYGSGATTTLNKKTSVPAPHKFHSSSLEDVNARHGLSAVSGRSHLKAREGAVDVGRGESSENVSEAETASIHSSSSDLSGSSPASKRKGKGGDHRAPLMRFNRAFSLRRARLGGDADATTATPLPPMKNVSSSMVLGPPASNSRPSSASSIASSSGKDARTRRISSSTKNDVPAVASRQASASAPFNRSDGGRFSLRVPRSAPIAVRSSGRSHHQQQQQTASHSSRPKSTAGKVGATARSNSTLSAKELEMKNWRRRKEYDPLKAAAEGRKKEAAARKAIVGQISCSMTSSKSESPSPTLTSFQRSASFHGTDGLFHVRGNTAFGSEDEVGLEADDDDEDQEEERIRESMEASRSRHYYRKSVGQVATSPSYESSEVAALRSRLKKEFRQCEMILESSEDESTSEAIRAYSHTDLTSENFGTTSPRGSPHLHPVMRHKSKIDALDNLVISTVHQLSCNLRSHSENLLKKLGEVHGQQCDQVLGEGGLEEVIARLASVESPVSSPQGRGVSRQLSGILKNMKRLEETLHTVDQVLDVVPVADNSMQRYNGDVRKNGSGALPPSSQRKWNGFQGRDYY